MYSEEEVQEAVRTAIEYERVCQSKAQGNGVYSHPLGRVDFVLEKMRRTPELFCDGQIRYLENIRSELDLVSRLGASQFLG